MKTAQAWTRADYRCGRCGETITATTEEQYIREVPAHQAAHSVWDRLDPVAQDGMRSILQTLMADPPLLIALYQLSMKGRQ